MDSSGTTVRMLGSTWNGSFGLAIDLERGIVVAIASNIEFDQPGDLVDAILAACRPLARAAMHR
jgi:hypothetical protein